MWLWLRLVTELGELVSIQKEFIQKTTEWEERSRIITTYRRKPSKGPFPCLYVCLELPEVQVDIMKNFEYLTEDEYDNIPKHIRNFVNEMVSQYNLIPDRDCIRTGEYDKRCVSIGEYERLLIKSESSKSYGGFQVSKLIDVTAQGSSIGQRYINDVGSALIPKIDRQKLKTIAKQICAMIKTEFPFQSQLDLIISYHMACQSTAAPIAIDSLHKCM